MNVYVKKLEINERYDWEPNCPDCLEVRPTFTSDETEWECVFYFSLSIYHPKQKQIQSKHLLWVAYSCKYLLFLWSFLTDRFNA